MYNNFNKSKNISIATAKSSIDFLYDSSLDNSYIDNIDLYKMNNSFNTNIKNQIEKNFAEDENLRRKDSAIELVEIKNSYSNNKVIGMGKSKNSKKMTNENNNKKVEFIVDDNSSSEEDDDDIFNIEIENVKQQQQQQQNHHNSFVSTSLSSSFLNSSYQVPNVKINQNLSLLSQRIQSFDKKRCGDINNFNNNNVSLNGRNDNKMNHSTKPFFEKMINYHLNNKKSELSSSWKTSKIRFGNQAKELKLKESPIKYSGLDILKPILKKKSAYDTNDRTVINVNSERKVVSLSRKKKNVHFKSENEECPFKKFECPSNIVNLPIYVIDSQLEPFLEVKLIKLDGFQSKNKGQLTWGKNVILESVGLIDDETQEHDIVRLTIQVRNLAFEKKVKVHYTLDNWKSVKVQEARYRSSEKNEYQEAIDKFILNIDTVEKEDVEESISHLQFAIQYLVNQQEFWDNNNGKNYSLKVDRTVRIPAKAIKSHPYCEGPVVRYKLKPGYHYPLFKSNLNEHPSADIPNEVTTPADVVTPDKNVQKNVKQTETDPNHPEEKEQSQCSTGSNNTCFSLERNSLENFLSSDDGDFSSVDTLSDMIEENKKDGDNIDNDNNNDEEEEDDDDDDDDNDNDNNAINDVNDDDDDNDNDNDDDDDDDDDAEDDDTDNNEKEDERENIINDDVFSWNEPILLRKPGSDKNQRQTSPNLNTKSNSIQSTDRVNSKKISMESGVERNNTFSSETLCDKDKTKEEKKNGTSLRNARMTSSLTSSLKSSLASNTKPTTTTANNTSSNTHPLDNAFKLPKHENWFKEAPSCIPFGSSPRKLYHPSNNFKLHQNPSFSKSLFGNKSQNQVLLEKEREEEEENKKRLNSKYSFSTHLSSSSSKYMRNNSYGNYPSLYHLYAQSPSQSPTTTTTSLYTSYDEYHTNHHHGNGNGNGNDNSNGNHDRSSYGRSIPIRPSYPSYTSNFSSSPLCSSLSPHPTTSTTANVNHSFTQNYMKSFISNKTTPVSSTKDTTTNLFATSHLYATQEDFISDHLNYF